MSQYIRKCFLEENATLSSNCYKNTEDPGPWTLLWSQAYLRRYTRVGRARTCSLLYCFYLRPGVSRWDPQNPHPGKSYANLQSKQLPMAEPAGVHRGESPTGSDRRQRTICGANSSTFERIRKWCPPSPKYSYKSTSSEQRTLNLKFRCLPRVTQHTTNMEVLKDGERCSELAPRGMRRSGSLLCDFGKSHHLSELAFSQPEITIIMAAKSGWWG